MNTPINDFLKQYAESGTMRLHMPGHKGRMPGSPLKEAARYDITEISGADSLFEAEGIIRQSEENAAALYGSGMTLYSAGGSTLCIQTMIALLCRPGDTIIAARNAHHSFLNACALLGVDVHWILPRYNDSFGVSGEVTAQTVELALEQCPEAKGVYVTSPDYLGCMSDIEAIAGVCRKKGRPLLVDNAHGAHLRFVRQDSHPMTLGASMCSDSWHKTLPVLTGGACLHISREFLAQTGWSREDVKGEMGLFASTSPSYLILLSMDCCCRYLEEKGRPDFIRLEESAAALYAAAEKKGIFPISKRYDSTKLTIDGYAVGMSGEELGEYFRKSGIECEYAAARHVVLMLSPCNTDEELARLMQVMKRIPAGSPRNGDDAAFCLPEKVMPIRDAVFAERETVLTDRALGRIAAESRIKCPPGVPVVIAGERIGPETQKLLKKSSIFSINVVK